ncbi:hypothetical protein BS47DRAFT_1396381 [Hydnum rufescens UP504]|uniref:Uncharacterized protein n=1 Tax=Hydnum rufescens UP504 TaxID=1448309 RepID=A0A9P6AQE9_9AGAM|nr:hypothetical protein BS47DRAFT_1396381 [Hydnum rufescens UP504]
MWNQDSNPVGGSPVTNTLGFRLTGNRSGWRAHIAEGFCQNHRKHISSIYPRGRDGPEVTNALYFLGRSKERLLPPDNVFGSLRLSGLFPDHLDLIPYRTLREIRKPQRNTEGGYFNSAVARPKEANTYPPPKPILRFPNTKSPLTYSPILTPPVVPYALLPTLPYGPSEQSLPGSLSATHILSTHIIPAAWRRSPSDLFIESEHEPPQNESKQDRKARIGIFRAFNMYRRKGPWLPVGLTLLVTHAVGFPKEIWVPTYAKIVEQTQASGTVWVNEIWAYENPNYRNSAVLSAGKFGVLSALEDESQGIVHFLLYYRPADHVACGGTSGFVGVHTLVGLAHPPGASALIRAAMWGPKLFHSPVALEPIVVINEKSTLPVYDSWITGALGRRAKWSSRMVDRIEAYNSYEAFHHFRTGTLPFLRRS